MTTFPADFLWGSATAAHQVEGNNVASDWWEREHAPGTTIGEPSGDACDSYHRYTHDMRILAGLGLDMYRFSVEWARIEPERGHVSRAELDHYRRMVDTARDLGIEGVGSPVACRRSRGGSGTRCGGRRDGCRGRPARTTKDRALSRRARERARACARRQPATPRARAPRGLPAGSRPACRRRA